ncbi:hypothetical protein IWW38_003543 [Coemansia aciculifera]|uniref:Uncharacterized protein n=1 Tax=Coemansia aciculifera TaxID=417176 RepID=A0ACC1M221_9FUNG|nr:hypothetical protein IWW38_003543 [Coemansia aciculifera]
MRFAIALGLFAMLAALSSAESPKDMPSDFVGLSNKAYIAKTGDTAAYRYDDYESGDCINVKKIFDDPETVIVTRGMAVKLCAKRNCKECFDTTETTDTLGWKMHAIQSFQVVGEE